MCAPVLISVYTRLTHLQRCVESLQLNPLAPQTDLFIVSDAPAIPQHQEAVEKVRSYVAGIKGFQSVHLFAWEINKGSAESIRSARMAIYENYDRQIFMEDDNVVSAVFLNYMNDALSRYANDEKVFGICGYNFLSERPASYKPEAYFMDAISAWGWATWKDKYMRFFEGYTLPDFKSTEFKAYSKKYPKPANNLRRMARQQVIWGDTKVNHYLSQKGMVCLFPCVSLVNNTGWDGTGEHCNQNDNVLGQQIHSGMPLHDFPVTNQIDPNWANQIKQFFALSFWSKSKTALYDFKVRIKKRLK